jgi:hypothetical protein
MVNGTAIRRMARAARIALGMAGALAGCHRDWDRFAEGSPGSSFAIRGGFSGGRTESSGRRYQVRGQLELRAARHSGGSYTIEGGLR